MTDDAQVLLKSTCPDLKLFRRGKVRDVYDLGDKLLVVSTDRISCFDVVLENGIPYKGAVLTAMSEFWFDFLKDVVPNHYLSNTLPFECKKYEPQLLRRSMVVQKTKPFPVECVVRGYLSGSGWKEYQKKQSVCSVPLLAGLKESEQLPEIIFTPTTKADVGHDQNVAMEYVENLVGKKQAQELKRLSIALYRKASEFAKTKGIIIADTKFEFGSIDGKIILIDEVLTPDSSRFWPVSDYASGRPQASFDKQFVRDYLEDIRWDKNPPAPQLPDEIINKTCQKYLEAYSLLTGQQLKK